MNIFIFLDEFSLVDTYEEKLGLSLYDFASCSVIVWERQTTDERCFLVLYSL